MLWIFRGYNIQFFIKNVKSSVIWPRKLINFKISGYGLRLLVIMGHYETLFAPLNCLKTVLKWGLGGPKTYCTVPPPAPMILMRYGINALYFFLCTPQRQRNNSIISIMEVFNIPNLPYFMYSNRKSLKCFYSFIFNNGKVLNLHFHSSFILCLLILKKIK